MRDQLIFSFIQIGLHVIERVLAGHAADEIKQDARDRADVAIDNALAKKRLEDRKKAR